MQMKIFFKKPPVRHLRGSRHKITQFRKPSKVFIESFEQKWTFKKERYLDYFNKIFVNKPTQIQLFVSSSNDNLGGCDEIKKSIFIVYVAGKKISPTFFMILFHELCHVYLHCESNIWDQIEKKYHFDIEELLAQLLTLKYFKKFKYAKDMPNSIFRNLPHEDIKRIKTAFKKFNKKLSLSDWFTSIYNPNTS